MTLEEAKGLKIGQTLYHTTIRGSDNKPERWRVNGKVKTWKRKPEVVRVPIKHGLCDYSYLTQDTLHLLTLA